MLFLIGTLGLPIFAQECEELEGEDLTVCLTLMVCMALEKDKARNQCLEVARQVLDKHDAQRAAKKQESEPKDPPAGMHETAQDAVEDKVEASSTQTPATEPHEERPGASAYDEEKIKETVVSEAKPESEKRRWFSWIRRSKRNDGEESANAKSDPEFTSDGVPKQFAATVVDVTKTSYNDALVVLSNRYVFVINRALQSRIEPGDVIVARKKEGLSGRRSFLFYGRGASVDAHRIDCSHVDPSKQTRARCAYATQQLGTTAL